MDNTGEPQRRKFQFSLRKLMLWMFVVAFWFGFFGMLHPGILVISMLWLPVAGIVRIMFRPRVACILSVAAGALLFVCVGYTGIIAYSIETAIGVFVDMLLFGTTIGFLLFLIVEGGFRFVDWADNKMRSTTDE
jgi:hypothetical protein